MDLGPPISDKKIKKTQVKWGPYMSVQKMVRIRQLRNRFVKEGGVVSERWGPALDYYDAVILENIKILAGTLPVGVDVWERNVVQRRLVRKILVCSHCRVVKINITSLFISPIILFMPRHISVMDIIKNGA